MILNKFPELYWHKFEFIYTATEDFNVPIYKGSAIRGLFGWALRGSSCITNMPDCVGCPEQKHCAYYNIFENELPEQTVWFLRGVKKVPHPFIIHPPQEKEKRYSKGKIFKVGLTVFGMEVKYFVFFLNAFIKMGERGLGIDRGKFKLHYVYSLDETENQFMIYNAMDDTLDGDAFRKLESSKYLNSHNSKKLKLLFETPARLQIEGKVVSNPDKITAEALITLLEKRYYALSKIFCEENKSEYPLFERPADLRINKNNLRFYHWNRYSSRQKTSIEMGGLIGEIELEGLSNELLYLLRIGEHIHIGKNTGFGLGKYKIIVLK